MRHRTPNRQPVPRRGTPPTGILAKSPVGNRISQRTNGMLCSHSVRAAPVAAHRRSRVPIRRRFCDGAGNDTSTGMKSQSRRRRRLYPDASQSRRPPRIRSLTLVSGVSLVSLQTVPPPRGGPRETAALRWWFSARCAPMGPRVGKRPSSKGTRDLPCRTNAPRCDATPAALIRRDRRGDTLRRRGTPRSRPVLCFMEPIDERITAARLMVLRNEPNAPVAIATLLGVPAMPPNLAERANGDIAKFVANGDATLAAQLIHAAEVRRSRSQP